MPPPDRPQRTQEQSIKARKHQLFESDEHSGEHSPRQTFADLLRATPADPLAPGVRAALWVVGALVIVILLAAFLKVGTRAPRPHARPAAPLAPAGPGGASSARRSSGASLVMGPGPA